MPVPPPDLRTVYFDAAPARTALTVLTPHIVRVRYAPQGIFAPRHSWAVPRADGDFPVAPYEVEQDADRLSVRTAAFEVRLARASGKIECLDRAGRVFCADVSAPDAVASPGAAPPAVPGTRVSLRKHLAADEHIYGCGERTGPLDKRGRSVINWNVDPAHGHGSGTDPLYMAFPLCFALRPGLAYGVFCNTTWRSRFDFGLHESDVWTMQADGGELDYYVLYGPSPAEVMRAFGTLLGHMPLPPRWALGYHQSRWGYKHADEMRALTTEFRRRQIPCDVLHFDIDYMRGYRVFTWDPARFPDPPALLAALRAQGMRAVTIIDPGVKIDPEYSVYLDGLAHDRFVRRADGMVFHGYVWPDDSVFADYTRPDVRAWWGDQQKVLVDAGISGIWNDMNEPAVFSKPFSAGFSTVGTIDLDAVQGPPDERTTHAEVHNLFGVGMAQASYEGLVRHLKGERPFVLSRSGFAGLQRWSAGWMGDNHSWWEHLELTLPQLLNMGLSAMPFVGVDIGGFGGNASPELFARWMQFGAFFPFCRGHSAAGTHMHEPWQFGARVEAICRDYLSLRYRLLPYLYALFWEAAQTGAPILRPLFYHFPDDETTHTLHDQAMLGPSLLLAPIYQAGREHRHVYLPAGQWYDWWTDTLYTGPQHILVHAPLEIMPLFVRAGAIIPSGPDLQYSDERPLDPLTLDLYPGPGAFTLYEDDGHTFEYTRGAFCTTNYTLTYTDGQLTLTCGPRQGAYTPPARRLRLRVHAMSAPPPGSAGTYDAARRILTLEVADGAEQKWTWPA